LAFIADRAKSDDWVWVHDAARPCLSHADIDKLIEALESKHDGALLAVPVHDTVKRADSDSSVQTTVDRKSLWRAMTPQVFRFAKLKQALEQSQVDQICVTDESSAIEHIGGKPFLVQGSDRNIKVTHPNDLGVAARTMQENVKENVAVSVRIGTGFDVHAFGEGDSIVLGGVKIPYSQGLVAHSDGDVLLHAVMDALLGALALGDIGKHFPDTDAQWKGADSRKLLRAVIALIAEKGYRVGNLDSTIMAQAPKMAPHIESMCLRIADDLEVAVSDVSVKATTTEHLGFTGRKEGIACQASVILVRI
jgi:2-C-methyl-D-erythritol 2,4-cyclodiphosphate synthase